MSLSCMHQMAVDPNRLDVTVITIPYPLSNPLFPRLPAENIDIACDLLVCFPCITIWIGVDARVELDQLRVPEHSNVKAANLVCHVNNLSTATGGKVQRVLG